MMRRIAAGRHRAQQFLLFVCLLIHSSLSAQAERLPVKNYTSADGLGSSFINSLMRDSRGFMWFCTRDGLSRFDGARFVTYRVGDKNAQPGVESVTETRDGSYWITTTSGLYRFKPDVVSQPDSTNWSRPALNAEFIDSRRGRLLEDRKGNLWYGGGPLFRLEQKDGKVSFQQIELNLPAPPMRPSGVIGMSEASDGSLWIYTSAGLARRLPDGRLIFYPAEAIATRDNSMCLLDEHQRVWYALGSGLYVLKPETLESLANLGRITVRPLSSAHILASKTETEIRLPEQEGEMLCIVGKDFFARDPAHRLCQTADKHIWLTSYRELIEFDGRAFHRFTATQGLPSGMSTMAEDSGGNLWISGQAVLARLDRRGFTSYDEADGFHSPAIHAINEAKDGNLYFADGDFYLSQFDGKRFQTLRPALAPNPISLWTSRYAFLDSRNEWWILTDEKLYRFAASDLSKPLSSYTSRDGLKANAMYQIFEDRRGDIWVSVQPPGLDAKGLARFERSNNRFHTFTEAEGFPSGKAVSAFAEDQNGNLWVGFYEGGIARYSDHRFTEFTQIEGMPSGLITDLLVDRNGRLWLASSGGGVGRIDDPGAENLNIVSLTADEGLSSNNIRTITEDNSGNIYCGTVRGVDRISPETNHIKHYSVNDGLAGDFVVDSRCDKSGVLWFATTNGLSRLAPVEDESQPSPPIWLGALRIAGVPQALSELGEREIGTIKLDHTQNNLQLDFFGLDFHAGESLRYQYRLEGAAEDWSAPTEQRSVTLAYLRPGTYRFEVRAINSHGAASEKPATVSFKISPPIWFSWWFVSLALILVAATALAIIRQRTARRRERERAQMALREVKEERLRELEQVRRRIAADLHDDIGSNLTRISLLSEVAQRRLDGHDGPVREQLSSVAKLSRELIDSMSEIVWAINPQKDHLGDLSQRMRHFASDLLTARQIDFRFVALDFDRDVKVGANVRREFFLIFKEGVNNIVRHSDCDSVEIEFRAEDGHLILTLSDNGKGFGEPENHNGHGLVSMRERIRTLDGRLEINSAPGKGAKLRFIIPLHPGSIDAG